MCFVFLPFIHYIHFFLERVIVLTYECVLFFTFLNHLIVFFLLRHCINARTHALTGARTHGRTQASISALIIRRTKTLFLSHFIWVPYWQYHFLGVQGVSDQTEYTDRILNNAKLAQASLNFRKRKRNGVKMSFIFVFLSNLIIAVIFDASKNSLLTLTVYCDQNKR